MPFGRNKKAKKFGHTLDILSKEWFGEKMSRDIRIFDGTYTASITVAFSNCSQVHPNPMKNTTHSKKYSKGTFISPEKISKPNDTITLGYQTHIHSVTNSTTNKSDNLSSLISKMNGNSAVKDRHNEEEKVNIDTVFNEEDGPSSSDSLSENGNTSLQDKATFISGNGSWSKTLVTKKNPTEGKGTKEPATGSMDSKPLAFCRRVIFPTLYDTKKSENVAASDDSECRASSPFQIENPLAPFFPQRSSTLSSLQSEATTHIADKSDTMMKMDMNSLNIPAFRGNKGKKKIDDLTSSSTHASASPTSLTNTSQEAAPLLKALHPLPSILKNKETTPMRKKNDSTQLENANLPFLGKVPSRLRLSLKDLYLSQLNSESLVRERSCIKKFRESKVGFLDATNHKLNLNLNDINLMKLDGDIQSSVARKKNADSNRVSFCKCLLSSSLKKSLSDTCLDQRISVDVDKLFGRSDMSSISSKKNNDSTRVSFECNLQSSMTRHISHEQIGRKKIRFDPRIWVHEYQQAPDVLEGWYTPNDMDRFKHEVLHRIRRYEAQKQRLPVSQKKKRTIPQIDILSSGTGRIISLGQSARRSHRSVRAIYTNPALTAEAESSDDEDSEQCCEKDKVISRSHQTLDDIARTEIRRVLLVEPHDIFARLLTRGIRDMLPQTQIICTRTGEEALECISWAKKISQRKGESIEFDLIIAEERLHVANDLRYGQVQSSRSESSGSALLSLLNDQQSQPSDSSFVRRVPVLIGMSAYIEQDGHKLESSGSDFVWSKPPPKMDKILKAALIRRLMQKRNKNVL